MGPIPSPEDLGMIPATMKAAVVHAFGAPLVIESVPVPTPGANEVLIRLVASGVCHTDVHAAEGDWPVKPMLPFVPGHEAVGDVVAVGPGVVGVQVGDRVGVPWLYSACGRCEYCGTGRVSVSLIPLYVVTPAQSTGAASAGSMFAGICPTKSALATMYSA